MLRVQLVAISIVPALMVMMVYFVREISMNARVNLVLMVVHVLILLEVLSVPVLIPTWVHFVKLNSLKIALIIHVKTMLHVLMLVPVSDQVFSLLVNVVQGILVIVVKC